MRRAFAAVILTVGLMAQALAGEVPQDELAAARIAFSLGCLNVVEHAQSLESQASDLGLVRVSRPKLERWPGDETWQAPSPVGEMFVVQHANEQRPCTLAVFGADGEKVQYALIDWFSGEGAPFKMEAPFNPATSSGPTLRWERGALDIGVVFTSNPDPEGHPDAPMLLATMYLTK